MTAVSEVAQDGQMRWVVEGEVYDLTPFLSKHPGGADFLLWSVDRDITIPVMTYHKNPAKTVLPILAKYKVPNQPAAACDGVKSKLGIPHFLLPSQFDAARDVPTYDFNLARKDLVINTARERILKPHHQAEIKRLDSLFDVVVASLLAAYLALSFNFLRGNVAFYYAIPCFVILRTCLAGGGHFYLHRLKPHCGDALFDVNYVGMHTTAQDGHVLIHHAYTQSDADVKRGFFGGMMGIPRAFRVPVHTAHKLFHVCTGMRARGAGKKNALFVPAGGGKRDISGCVRLSRNARERSGISPYHPRLLKRLTQVLGVWKQLENASLGAGLSAGWSANSRRIARRRRVCLGDCVAWTPRACPSRGTSGRCTASCGSSSSLRPGTASFRSGSRNSR